MLETKNSQRNIRQKNQLEVLELKSTIAKIFKTQQYQQNEGTKGKNSDVDDRTIETTQSKLQRENRLQKT